VIKEMHQRGSKDERQIVGASVRHPHFKRIGVLPNLKKV
jgi:hypothetical protein